ncbi:MAG: hypothetical protein ABI128_10900 [Rhodanobacter sp.]
MHILARSKSFFAWQQSTDAIMLSPSCSVNRTSMFHARFKYSNSILNGRPALTISTFLVQPSGYMPFAREFVATATSGQPMEPTWLPCWSEKSKLNFHNALG